MALHDELIARMTPGLVAGRVVIGAFVTVVQAGERCGLATTMRPADGRGRPAVTRAGKLAGMALTEMAALVHSENPMEASLGMAAINAGMAREGIPWTMGSGQDLLREKAAGKRLAVVGHFPFVEKLRSVARSLAILELDPREGDLPASAGAEVIPRAEVVAITGSAFSNRTMSGLLDLCRGKWVMVLGPTSPLSPVLFDHGVKAIAGSVVTEPEVTMREAGEGAILRQITGVKKVLALRPAD